MKLPHIHHYAEMWLNGIAYAREEYTAPDGRTLHECVICGKKKLRRKRK